MDGLLYVNKPKDLTSRDVVNKISKELKTKKVGHTGTLDPLATGVLIICIGKATKIVEIITAEDKEYEAEIILGIKTDTGDITGKIIQEEKVNLSNTEIELALQKMIGKYDQEVPIYSAVKINGKKLYEYARNNEQIELPKRKVEIKTLELISDIEFENDKIIFSIRTLVSKGTYIRSLIEDIASKLNTIGLMNNLIRTQQGNINLGQCLQLDEINEQVKLQSIDEVLSMNEIVVDQELEEKIMNGQILDNIYDLPVLFKNSNNQLLAIYKEYEKDSKKIKPWKML